MSGGTPHRRGADRTAEDLIWDSVLQYGFFAVKHNWTPEQVDSLPGWYEDRLPDYHQMLDEIHNADQARSDRIRRAHERGGW